MVLPGGLFAVQCLVGRSGEFLLCHSDLQGHSCGALGDGADTGETAKPMAGREEVSGCEEVVGGRCGILSAPQLWETPTDLNLLAEIWSTGKAALCLYWEAVTAHMLQTFPENCSSPLLLWFAWPEHPW